MSETEPKHYIQYIRSLVGTQRIFLVFATIILRDKKGRVLLQRRTDFDFWGLPGGVLELDENIISCAHRELQEETGLRAGELSLVGIYSDPEWAFTYPNGDQVQQFTICLQGEVAGGELFADGVETSKLKFFHQKDIPWQQLLSWYKAMLTDLFKGHIPAFSPPQRNAELTPQIPLMRQFVGHQPFVAAGAVGVTVQTDGRILMMQRSDNQQWTFPGGFCDLGENAAFTAVRETQEETGLVVSPIRLLGVYTPGETYTYWNGDQLQSAIAVFQMQLEGGKIRPEGKETLAVKWKTPDEIRALDVHPLVKRQHLGILDHLHKAPFILV